MSAAERTQFTAGLIMVALGLAVLAVCSSGGLTGLLLLFGGAVVFTLDVDDDNDDHEERTWL